MVKLTPEQNEKLTGMISEMHDSLMRMEGEKEFQKDVAARAKEELNIAPAEFNKIAKNSFSGKLAKDYHKMLDTLELAEKVGHFSFEKEDEIRARSGAL